MSEIFVLKMGLRSIFSSTILHTFDVPKIISEEECREVCVKRIARGTFSPFMLYPTNLPSSAHSAPHNPFRNRTQRRKIIAAIVMHLRRGVRKYTKHRRYVRSSWEEWLEFLNAEEDDKEFRQHYRVPLQVFKGVLERIKHRIMRNSVKQRAAGNDAIDTETMLAMTLRWLAGTNAT